VTTNVNGSVRRVSRELDTILVGALAGPEGAGLYKIAKQVAAIPAMITDPLYHAIYPDLSRMWVKHQYKLFRRIMLKSAVAAGSLGFAIWLFFLLFGEIVITVLFGAEFVGAQAVLVWYMLAMIIAIAGFPLQPAMLAMGKPKLSFYVSLITTVLYFIALIPLLNAYSAVGAGIAYVIYYLIWTVLMILFETWYYRSILAGGPDVPG
jgi:O-antigen/teichoic acid export membrane protein